MNFKKEINKTIVDLQKNNFFVAEVRLKKIIKEYVKEPVPYYLLGVINFRFKKDVYAALENIEKSIKLRINDDNAYLIGGVIEIGKKNYIKALDYLESGQKINNVNRDILFNLGIVHSELGNYDCSKKYYEKCIQINANDFQAKLNLANTLLKAKNYKESELLYKNLLTLKKSIVHKNYWSVLMMQKKYKDSLKVAKELIEIEDTFDNNKNLLLNLVAMRDHENAEILLNKFSQEDLELDYLKAKIQINKQRYDEALIIQEKYIKKLSKKDDPKYMDLLLLTLTEIKDKIKAENLFKLIIEKNKGTELENKYKYYYGIWNLNIGNYRKGFEFYNNRLSDSKKKLMKPKLLLAEERVCNKKILLYSEQGVGDIIFYLNLSQQLLEQGNKVTVIVEKRLIGFLREKFKEILFIEKEQSDTELYDKYHLDFEVISYIGNIPMMINFNDNTIDYFYNKMKKREDKVYKIRKIGLSWSSKNKNLEEDKSLSLEMVESLLQKYKNIEFINLQYDCDDDIHSLRRYENFLVYDEIDKKNDIDGLIKLITECDIVLTVSNTNAHICGILGKETFMIIPNPARAIWYWRQIFDGKSLWYPSINIIKKEKNMNTDSVFNFLLNFSS